MRLTVANVAFSRAPVSSGAVGGAEQVVAMLDAALVEAGHRSIVVAMAIIPLVFLIQPLVSVFAASSTASAQLSHRHELLYMLAIPALVPAALAVQPGGRPSADGVRPRQAGVHIAAEQLCAR